jgi:hypothetical protein
MTVLNHFDVRWVDGYSAVTDAPSALAVAIEQLAAELPSSQDCVELAVRELELPESAPVWVGVLRFVVEVSSSPRPVGYVHAVVMPPGYRLAPEGWRALVAQRYGSAPEDRIRQVYEQLAESRRDRGRELLRELEIRPDDVVDVLGPPDELESMASTKRRARGRLARPGATATEPAAPAPAAPPEAPRAGGGGSTTTAELAAMAVRGRSEPLGSDAERAPHARPAAGARAERTTRYLVIALVLVLAALIAAALIARSALRGPRGDEAPRIAPEARENIALRAEVQRLERELAAQRTAAARCAGSGTDLAQCSANLTLARTSLDASLAERDAARARAAFLESSLASAGRARAAATAELTAVAAERDVERRRAQQSEAELSKRSAALRAACALLRASARTKVPEECGAMK